MGRITVVEEGAVGAPAELTYRLIADDAPHVKFLPDGITDFKVTPSGAGCTVRIETVWNGAGGVGGFFERTSAPRVMRKMYADELARLDAREQAAAGS